VIPTKGIGIYINSDTVRYHFDAITNFSFQFNNYYSNLPEFLEDQSDLKFAGFHVPFPRNPNWTEEFHALRNKVNHTFVLCSELHPDIVEDLIALDFPNVTMFICGFIDHDFKHAKIEQWLDWFITSSYFYSEANPNFLKEHLVTGQEKYLFDILLGTEKPHRDAIYNYVRHNNMSDQMIMTYHRRYNMNIRTSDQYILDESNIEFIDDAAHRTSQQIRYHGRRMVLSQVIPIDIYNQTHYTIVADTTFTNNFNFYTEKIVKPILAGRLFVAIGSRYYLKNLKSLGFKSFDNVIDESYDSIADPETRWLKAMEQVAYLCTQDPQEIKAKIKDAVEHNQRLISFKEWTTRFHLKLHDYLLDYITTAHIDGDWQGSWPSIRT
jgi:hypothetical protein